MTDVDGFAFRVFFTLVMGSLGALAAGCAVVGLWLWRRERA